MLNPPNKKARVLLSLRRDSAGSALLPGRERCCSIYIRIRELCVAAGSCCCGRGVVVESGREGDIMGDGDFDDLMVFIECRMQIYKYNPIIKRLASSTYFKLQN